MPITVIGHLKAEGRKAGREACAKTWTGPKHHLMDCQFNIPEISSSFGSERNRTVTNDRLKRFTRIVSGLEDLRLKRLDRLGLFSLERRRLRHDHMEVYKIKMGHR